MPSHGRASAKRAISAQAIVISMMVAMGRELVVPNRPTRGEASAPSRNCRPPSSAEAATGAPRVRAWPMVIEAGRIRPMPPMVMNRVIQVPVSVSPTVRRSMTWAAAPADVVANPVISY